MNGFEGCYPAGLCDDDVSIVKIGFNIMDVAQNMDALKTVFQFLPELFVFSGDQRYFCRNGIVQQLIKIQPFWKQTETAAHEKELWAGITGSGSVFKFPADRNSGDENLIFRDALLNEGAADLVGGGHVGVRTPVDPLRVAGNIRDAGNQRYRAAA